jgi:hypothetical protein
MPAPVASMMQQLARLKFMSFALKVPTNWSDPQGDPQGDQYKNAFKDDEKMAVPGMPPLFQPATMNKYHVDAQKMHIAKIGKFIDDTMSAIASAWGQWQQTATMTGILINAVTASAGTVVGMPWTPLILASGPKSTPNEMKYTNVIAKVIGTSWQTFQSTIIIPGLPWYPAYAMVPMPLAPPMPNIPVPFAALTQVPVSISCQVMKTQMIAELGDPQAPFHKELFESICDSFEKTYDLWKVSCMVTNVLPLLAPVPTFAPPYVPAGPVVGGTAMMPPGGFT